MLCIWYHNWILCYFGSKCHFLHPSWEGKDKRRKRPSRVLPLEGKKRVLICTCRLLEAFSSWKWANKLRQPGCLQDSNFCFLQVSATMWAEKQIVDCEIPSTMSSTWHYAAVLGYCLTWNFILQKEFFYNKMEHL